MAGGDTWAIPDLGRDHYIEFADQRWEIRPRFSQTNAVEAYYEEQGLSRRDNLGKKDMGAIYERCLAFLTPEQLTLFEGMRPEQQQVVCSKLWRIHQEITDGIVRPNPGEDLPPLEQARALVDSIRDMLHQAEASLAEAVAMDAAEQAMEAPALADPTS